MWEYSTPLQFAKIILVSQLLQAAGVPYANLCVYMAGGHPNTDSVLPLFQHDWLLLTLSMRCSLAQNYYHQLPSNFAK